MLRPLVLPDADVRLNPDWLAPAEAAALFDALQDGVAWENHPVRLFGRELPAPRLSSWVGDADAVYRYSGLLRAPHPWTPPLTELRDRLRSELGVDFNSVLANLYRDGRDAMGWHSDDEPELGPGPVIAAVSLGATRRFVLKARRGDTRLALELPPGSLLVMQGATQANYRHALPRTARPVGPRINLTFREVRAVR
ncbi:alpha-ketoglutarate-dependent dioxygenase AlkB family protein [Lysobacter sp. HA18]